MDYPLYELSEKEFPGALCEIPDKPKMLYARGTLPRERNKLLTVVGARTYTAYGEQVVEHLLGGLAGYPISIISGLAIGIDALAHKAALRHSLHTLAVPGSGLSDSALYPRQNRKLAYEILEAGGGLVSEFEPDFTPMEWAFPQRNRIMAGIANAVLVVEAQRKSGTLITARLATDYNRDVLAVPGSIFSIKSEGTHLLISLGATPVASAEEIIQALGLSPRENTSEDDTNLSPEEKALLALLDSPRTHDELIRGLARPAQETNALIMLMELHDRIRESGGLFVRGR